MVGTRITLLNSQIQIGDMTLDAEGDVFLGNVAFKRGDAINHEFGGYQAYRDAGSSELRIIDPLGYEERTPGRIDYLVVYGRARAEAATLADPG